MTAKKPADIYQAMHAVMQKIGYVQKTGRITGGGNYKYAGEGDLIAALRPHCVDHGIVIHPLAMQEIHQDSYTTGRGTSMNRTEVVLTYRFAHAPSGSFCDVTVAGEGADSGDKSSNKAMTGAFKYALRQAFMIETGDDPDESQDNSDGRMGKMAEHGRALEKKGKLPVATKPPWTGDIAESQDEAPKADGNGNKPEAEPEEDVDHLGAALEAGDLKIFAYHVQHVPEVKAKYKDNFHIVGALTSKYPEDHGLKTFVFGTTKQGDYLQWLVDRKAQGAA